jgi:DNA helicase HerA-like ATPase
MIRIAAEGRKFGLYLLVSTQRPQKIAENVLTQADNLVLMRLNSLAEPGVHPGGVLVRPAEPDRPGGHLPPGGGPDRR